MTYKSWPQSSAFNLRMGCGEQLSLCAALVQQERRKGSDSNSPERIRPRPVGRRG